MASLLSVRLNKGDSASWGFRLQGGKDFGTPLVIQKVTVGSPAERAGLVAGDSVIKINNTDVFNLPHKQAQDVVMYAGNGFEMTIQRGGSTWKPSVTPTGTFSAPSRNINNLSPVTRTSLAAHNTENIGAIGTGHNVAAKPFLNGTANGGSKLINNQYNTPVKLYSEESIAETLSAQTEVLSTGALGVNFKKNEKNYDASKSDVLRMIQESEKEPRSPEPVYHHHEVSSGIDTSPSVPVAGLRHVIAPENKPAPPTPQLPPGQNICADCERLIVGVFVRIKEKNLHVECFKCSTCGTSLKNVGYYNINNKLYCDIHAKLAARANPPAPGLVPVTVSPGGKAPANAISAALASHNYPTTAPLSPPNAYQQPASLLPSGETKIETGETTKPLESLILASDNQTNNNIASSPVIPNNNLLNIAPRIAPVSFSSYSKSFGSSGPKPFSSVSGPVSPSGYNASTLPRAAPSAAPLSPAYNSSTLPRAAPLSPAIHSVTSHSPASSAGRFPPSSIRKPVNSGGQYFKGRSVQNIVWPPLQDEPECPTACPLYFPPPSQVQIPSRTRSKTYSESICSEVEEINRSEYYHEPEMSELGAFTSGRRSVVECAETISETVDRLQLIEKVMRSRPSSPPKTALTEQTPVAPVAQKVDPCIQTLAGECCMRKDTCELKRPAAFNPENAVPQKWESPMLQALTVAPDFSQIPGKKTVSALGSALAIAPVEPFHTLPPTSLEPIPLPEETEPYFPPEHSFVSEKREQKVPREKPEVPDTAMVKALRTAPDRVFSPIMVKNVEPIVHKKKVDPTAKYFADLPKPIEHLTMSAALTTAPDRSYSPLQLDIVQTKIESTQEVCESKKQTWQSVNRENLTKPLKKSELPESFQMKHEDEPKAPSQFMPIFQGFSCSFQNKNDYSQFQVQVSTTPPVPNPGLYDNPGHIYDTNTVDASRENLTETHVTTTEQTDKQNKEKVVIQKQAEELVLKKPVPLAELHKPHDLPQYQVSISDNAEADLRLMEKINTAQVRHDQHKQSEIEAKKLLQETTIMCEMPTKFNPAPVNPNNPPPQIRFQPVSDDQPQNTTFSPRPRPVTPSMINKPPPVIPYYQANLVAQKYGPAALHVLDVSPNVSRSPSPCPDRGRSPSPCPEAGSSVRAKSPAPGPPPNPLQPSRPPPTKQDFKVEEARKELSEYIPHYKEKREEMEQRMYTGNVRLGAATNISENRYQTGMEQESQLTSEQITQDKFIREQMQRQQKLHMEAVERTGQTVSQTSKGISSTQITENSNLKQQEDKNQGQTHSVENLPGGVCVQRKKTVTEEFERTQKSDEITIEKNVTSTRSHPFHDVNVPVIEQQGIIGLHVTNPHHIESPFITKEGGQSKKVAQPQAPPPKVIPMEPPIPPTPTPQRVATPKFNATTQLPPPPPPPPLPPLKDIAKQIPPKPPMKHVTAPGSSKSNQNVKSNIPDPNIGAGGGRQTGAVGIAPKRGRGILNAAALGGTRVPLCGQCHGQIRGPFITALGKIWCPEHFICATPSCRRPLQDLGFVEERGQLYCEYCFEQYLAPPCSKCNSKIKGDCLKAIGKNFHPECFNCSYCGKLFGNSPFFLEDGAPYCEADWNELFTTKCYACGFPVEAGDRWVEALNNNYHSQCFNCSMCKKNLEGQSFFAKGGRPFCKAHAR